MIALALLLAVVQAEPDPASAEGEEIVVSATFGRTTMLFDKGGDGKLRNCRIMKSSGSARRDQEACQAVPVCYEGTADEVTECVELAAVEPAVLPFVPGDATAAPGRFDISKMMRPEAPPAVGPRVTSDAPDSDPHRVGKLPPPPSAPAGEPAIKVTVSDGAQP